MLQPRPFNSLAMSQVPLARPLSQPVRFLRSPALRPPSNRVTFQSALSQCRAILLRARSSLLLKLLRPRRLSSPLLHMFSRPLSSYRAPSSPPLRPLNLLSSRSPRPPLKRHRLMSPSVNKLQALAIERFLGRLSLCQKVVLLKPLALLPPMPPLRHPESLRLLVLQKLDSRRIHSRTRPAIDLSSLSPLPQHLLDLRPPPSRTYQNPRPRRTWHTHRRPRD